MYTFFILFLLPHPPLHRRSRRHRQLFVRARILCQCGVNGRCEGGLLLLPLLKREGKKDERKIQGTADKKVENIMKIKFEKDHNVKSFINIFSGTHIYFFLGVLL